MLAIKGSWAGQAFAVARSNDSGGSKSRIRRSKAERKEMVESFIKKYQKLNNGTYPSLNLTHKEVGGSFYKVREIIREIIQENRVLGPAKLTAREHNIDQLLEPYPLGAISVEPQTQLFVSSNETHVLINPQETREDLVLAKLPTEEQQKSNQLSVSSPAELTKEEQNTNQLSEECSSGEISVEYQTQLPASSDESQFILSHQLDSSEELVLNSCTQVDNGKIVNGRLEGKENEETDKMMNRVLEVSETLEAEKNVKELEPFAAKVTNITAGVLVETFPLRHSIRPTQSLGEISQEDKQAEKMERELENESPVLTQEREPGNCSLVPNINSSVVSGSPLVDETIIRSLEMEAGLVDEKAVLDHGTAVSESLNCSRTKNGDVYYIQNDKDLEKSQSGDSASVVLKTGQALNEITPISSPSVNSTKNLSGTTADSFPEMNATKNAAKVHGSQSCCKESSSTLDRINLESWPGASRKPAGQENNPILGVLKAFIGAIMKFWL